ncbi:MAG TPA: DUF6600 domain-containing protein [Gemmatimonadales bacterium]|jgi:hypothetical protein
MRLARFITPALVLVLLPTPRQADRPDDDPPSRVGRLSFLSGSVSFRPGTVDDWTDATINYPLHAGDHVWTDADARAELTVGSSAMRLAPQSAFGFLALDDRTTQVRLSQGSLEVRVRELGDDDSFEIDTPTGAVSLLQSGTYRVDVDPTGDTTTVTVRHGQADVTAAGSAFPVHAGDAAVVAGGDSPSYDIRDAARPDEWEDWCSTRDRRWDDSRSSQYVSRETIGSEDLDDNGEWRDTPDYGPVWSPHTTIVGWAPYRYGRWVWVEPWGWTWVDDAPWGFAPFHYGRWAYWDGGWVWVPGRRVARPVYAPALVVFVGGRNSGVAWFPLGPEEPYVPAYRVSNRYFRNVNVTNVNVTNITVTNVNVTTINYRNRRAPDAFTVVSQEAFVRSRAVDKSVIVVPRERLDQARVVGNTARVVPDRHSVLGRPDIMTVRRPPPAVTTREVVVRREPPPPPVPFTVRREALRAHPGRPLDAATLGTLRRQSPPGRTTPLVRPAVPVAAQDHPVPVLRPTREGLPPPRALPPPAPAERPAPEQRPDRAGPPERVEPSRPSERPRPTPQPAERPAPEERPASKPRPQRDAQPPRERPAPERRAPKGRAAERDTTKEKKP